MRIYFVTDAGWRGQSSIYKDREFFLLWSYFSVKQAGGKRGGELLRNQIETNSKTKLFLDSGAFSAWTQGIEINIQEYIDFIKEYQDTLELYANLDIIPKGNSVKDKREAAQKTLENQYIMEQAGLSPLPVFHVGEPIEYLEHYVKNYDYIALGGMVGKPKNVLVSWLNNCFGNYICDDKGLPKVKIHGFGLASFPLMLNYPFYSVDNTKWVKVSRMGAIYVPRYRNGKWIYNEKPWRINVSNRNPSRKEAGKHIDTLSPRQREIILDYIHIKGYKLGKSSFKKVPSDYELLENERWVERKPKNTTDYRLVEVIEEEGLCNQYQLRDEMYTICLKDFEQSMPEWPWPFKPAKLRGLSI